MMINEPLVVQVRSLSFISVLFLSHTHPLARPLFLCPSSAHFSCVTLCTNYSHRHIDLYIENEACIDARPILNT